jgi:hypothetical protein
MAWQAQNTRFGVAPGGHGSTQVCGAERRFPVGLRPRLVIGRAGSGRARGCVACAVAPLAVVAALAGQAGPRRPARRSTVRRKT